MPRPFKAPRPRRMDPEEEYERLLRGAPPPETIHLSPRERAALAAYRARREAIRRQRDAVHLPDPMLETWMP